MKPTLDQAFQVIRDLAEETGWTRLKAPELSEPVVEWLIRFVFDHPQMFEALITALPEYGRDRQLVLPWAGGRYHAMRILTDGAVVGQINTEVERVTDADRARIDEELIAKRYRLLGTVYRSTARPPPPPADEWLTCADCRGAGFLADPEGLVPYRCPTCAGMGQHPR